MLNDVFTTHNAEHFCETNDFNDTEAVFPELDSPITYEEVVNGIKSLKRNKASGCDDLLNEYFIESFHILAGHITDIFNNIFDSGCFPEVWSKGHIVPIYQKGDKLDVNSYRGITLLSNFGKLFTNVLNKRITDLCNSNTKISDRLFGFRKGRSTTDAVFVLDCLVKKILNEK